MSDIESLSDAERFAIRQTLVAEWRDDYSVLSLVNALAATVGDILATRTRMAAEAGEKRGAERERERIAQAIEELPVYYVQGEGDGWLHAVRTEDALRIARAGRIGGE